MAEVIQSVKTVFTADIKHLAHDLREIERAAGPATQAVAGVDAELAQMSKRRSTAFVAPPVFAGQTGGKNAILDRPHRAESMADDSILEELDRLKKAANESLADIRMKETMDEWRTSAIGATPSIAGLGDAVQGVGGKAAGAVGDMAGLKAGVKDAIEPFDSFKSAATSVVSNLGFLAGGAWAVVEGVGALADAFSRAPEITAQYQEAIKGLTEDLDRAQKATRDLRVELGLEPAQTPFASKLEELQGNKIVGGSWEEANNKVLDIENNVARLQGNLRDVGVGINSRGGADRLSITDGGPVGPQTPSQIKYAKDVANELAKALTNLDIAIATRTELETQASLLRSQTVWEEIMSSQEVQKNLAAGVDTAKNLGVALTGGLDSFVDGAGKALGAIIGGVQLSYGINPIQKFIEGIFGEKKPTKEPTTIDARGARITLNTTLKTDDPARFASTALKTAFLGAAARPLSATLGLGTPPLANGRR